MKTIDLIKKLKPQHRARVLNNSTAKDLERDCTDLAEAVALAFVWSTSPEGSPYWTDVCGQLTNGEYTFTEEESKGREGIFPENDGERQKYPLAQTDLFFPVADAEFSKFCMVNQQKHCPEATKVTWARDRSVGDGSQLRRHLMEFLKAVEDGDIEKANKEIKSVDWRGRELSQRWHTKMPPYDK